MILDKTLIRTSPTKHFRLAQAAAPPDAGNALNVGRDVTVFGGNTQLSVAVAPVRRSSTLCSYCGQDFDTVEKRERHTAARHPHGLLCTEGARKDNPIQYHQMSSYQKHIRSKHVDKLFARDSKDCICTFSCEDLLKEHQRLTHGNAPSLPCQRHSQGCFFKAKGLFGLWKHQTFQCTFRTQEENADLHKPRCGLGQCDVRLPLASKAMKSHRRTHEMCIGCGTTFPDIPTQSNGQAHNERMKQWSEHLEHDCSTPPEWTHPCGRDAFKYATHNGHFYCRAGG